MSELLSELKKGIDAREKEAVACREYFNTHELQVIALLANLKDTGLLRASMDSHSLDLNISGDKEILKSFWHKMRTSGYETDYKPEENEVSFCCWWNKEDEVRIWLSFSSTICKRVKIGTETKEIDIYEVVCE